MKNNKGFNLVELMVVIIIVGILSFISFNMYKGYKKQAKMTEGKALLDEIINAEEIYYGENDEYFSDSAGFRESMLSEETGLVGINAGGNKYFKSFNLRPSGNSIEIETRDTDNKITMQVILSRTSEAVFNTFES